MTLDGTLDPTLSYHVRLENRLFWAAPSAQLGSSAAFPGGTVAATPSLTGISTVNGYPANTSVRLNYAYAQYNDPSGLNASIGRINETDGSLGLLWADQWNGATAGYNKYGLNARVSYGFTWPIYDSTVNNNPLSQPTPGSSCAAAISGVATTFLSKCSGLTTQVLAGQLSYNVNKQFMAAVLRRDVYRTDDCERLRRCRCFHGPVRQPFRGFAVRALPRRDRKSPSVARGRGKLSFRKRPEHGRVVEATIRRLGSRQDRFVQSNAVPVVS